MTLVNIKYTRKLNTRVTYFGYTRELTTCVAYFGYMRSACSEPQAHLRVYQNETRVHVVIHACIKHAKHVSYEVTRERYCKLYIKVSVF